MKSTILMAVFSSALVCTTTLATAQTLIKCDDGSKLSLIDKSAVSVLRSNYGDEVIYDAPYFMGKSTKYFGRERYVVISDELLKDKPNVGFVVFNETGAPSDDQIVECNSQP